MGMLSSGTTANEQTHKNSTMDTTDTKTADASVQPKASSSQTVNASAVADKNASLPIPPLNPQCGYNDASTPLIRGMAERVLGDDELYDLLEFEFTIGEQLTLVEIERRARLESFAYIAPPPPSQLFCHHWAQSNAHTRNIGRLTALIIDELDDYRLIDESTGKADTTTTSGSTERRLLNALFMLHLFAKYIAERSDNGAMRSFFGDADEPHHCLARELLAALIGFLVDIPVVARTYHVHLECVRLLISTLSTQLASEATGTTPPQLFLDESFAIDRVQAGRLVQVLLLNFVQRHQAPPSGGVFNARGGTVLDYVAGVASTLVLSVPLTAYEWLTRRGKSERGISKPLADMSVLLLLALVHIRRPSSSKRSLRPFETNPYRWQLFNAMDTLDVAPLGEQAAPNAHGSVRIAFPDLYYTLAAQPFTTANVLLLSFLLRNENFCLYSLSRVDMETMLTPLLQRLYSFADEDPLFLRLCLSIVAELASYSSFAASSHTIIFETVPWLQQQRAVTDISLGSLLLIAVMRVARYNLAKLRDEDVHTLCKRILCSMCDGIASLHAVAADRLVKLLSVLLKKRERLHEALCSVLEENDEEEEERSDGADGSESASGGADASSESLDGETRVREETDDEASLRAELAVYGDFLDTILVLLEAALVEDDEHNPFVLYELVRQPDIVRRLANDVEQNILAHNVLGVVQAFQAILDERMQEEFGGATAGDAGGAVRDEATRRRRVDEARATLSSKRVIEIISERATTLRRPDEEALARRHAARAQLRFVEEEAECEPLVWRLIAHVLEYRWAAERVHQFDANIIWDHILTDATQLRRRMRKS